MLVHHYEIRNTQPICSHCDALFSSFTLTNFFAATKSNYPKRVRCTFHNLAPRYRSQKCILVYDCTQKTRKKMQTAKFKHERKREEQYKRDAATFAFRLRKSWDMTATNSCSFFIMLLFITLVWSVEEWRWEKWNDKSRLEHPKVRKFAFTLAFLPSWRYTHVCSWVLWSSHFEFDSFPCGIFCVVKAVDCAVRVFSHRAYSTDLEQ